MLLLSAQNPVIIIFGNGLARWREKKLTYDVRMRSFHMRACMGMHVHVCTYCAIVVFVALFVGSTSGGWSFPKIKEISGSCQT